jgi:translation initiation factor IF-2
MAEREEIDIRLYSVIYHAISEVRDALEGLLSPERLENITATVEVRETFKVPRQGMIAGCHVSDGKIKRSDKIHLIRDGVVIYDGTLSSLKRFKDDVREVQSGYECGIGIENFNDLKIGDQIEAYEIVEKRRTLAEA